MLGLRFYARAFSSCGKRGPLFIAVHGPFTVAASLVVGHRLQTRRLNSCGSRAKLLHGMWDLPRPRLEPMSPALAGRFSATVPPGKPSFFLFLPFLLRQMADRVLVLRPAVRPQPLRWGSQLQDIGPPETSQPHIISNSESSPRDLHLNTKTQLHSMTSKLQGWTPYAKQLARQEHNPTH